MSLRYHREAEAELDEALAFYAGQHASLPGRLLRDVAAGESAIAEQPQAWRRIGGVFRVLWLRRFPYGLIYHAAGEDITVYAVAHMRRKPGYWLGRAL